MTTHPNTAQDVTGEELKEQFTTYRDRVPNTNAVPTADHNNLDGHTAANDPFAKKPVTQTHQVNRLGLFFTKTIDAIHNPEQARKNLPRLQLVGGVLMAAGGAAALVAAGAAGGASIGAVGLVTTGAINSIRSGIQIHNVHQATKNGGSKNQAEMKNSTMSAGSNSPQALDALSANLSAMLAPLAVITSHVLRFSKYAAQSKKEDPQSEQGHDQAAANVTQDAALFSQKPATSLSGKILGPISRASSASWDFVKKSVAKISDPLQDKIINPAMDKAVDLGAKFGEAVGNAKIGQFKVGEYVMNKSPAALMATRGGMQLYSGILAGGTLTATAGLTAGALAAGPIAMAGLTYVTAAWAMMRADSAKKSPKAENNATANSHQRNTQNGETETIGNKGFGGAVPA